MKRQISELIENYISDYQKREGIATCYGEPLVGFADAWHPYVQNLPRLISPSHELPQNVLPDAKIIIAYYVPFTKDLAKTNWTEGILASPEWARAYEETNALLAELNDELIHFIHAKAGQAGTTPKAVTFTRTASSATGPSGILPLQQGWAPSG